MKRETSWVVLALALVGVGGFLLQGRRAQAQGPEASKEKRTITTSGSAAVRVRPDAARVFFGVQTLATTVKAARTENNARVQKVMASFSALKIPDLKMKSSNVQLELERRRPGGGDLAAEIAGYRVTHTFTVLVQSDDPERLAELANRVLDAALENGANQVEQVVFLKQDQAEARRQALGRAVEEALRNARALAQGAQVAVRETLTIHGEPQYSYGGNQRLQNSFTPGEDSPALVAGDLEITCNVSVKCAF